MTQIVDENHINAALSFKRAMAIYMENRDLIMMGGYKSGTDNALDRAIEIFPKLTSYQMQNANQPSTLSESQVNLIQTFSV